MGSDAYNLFYIFVVAMDSVVIVLEPLRSWESCVDFSIEASASSKGEARGLAASSLNRKT